VLQSCLTVNSELADSFKINIFLLEISSGKYYVICVSARGHGVSPQGLLHARGIIIQRRNVLHNAQHTIQLRQWLLQYHRRVVQWQRWGWRLCVSSHVCSDNCNLRNYNIVTIMSSGSAAVLHISAHTLKKCPWAFTSAVSALAS